MRRESGLASPNPPAGGEGGQTLIEVLLALGVAVIIVTAITAVIVTALNNATFTKNQNLANQYVQQGMEIVRAIRDKSWNDFFNYNLTNYCLPQDSTVPEHKTGPSCEGQGDIFVGGVKFIREITLNRNYPDCRGPTNTKVKVTVKVQWSDSKCPEVPPQARFCHEVKLVSCFTKINVVPTP